jgi:hypothetical protein
MDKTKTLKKHQTSLENLANKDLDKLKGIKPLEFSTKIL